MNPNYSHRHFPPLHIAPFDAHFPALIDPLALDFVRMCLEYDPKNRPDPIDALRHPFFKDMYRDKMMVAPGVPLPMHIFDFTEYEYRLSGRCIEFHLLPEGLPAGWMGYVNRVFHAEAVEAKRKLKMS